MFARWKKPKSAEPDSPTPSALRPSPRVALQISLGLHSLLVLALIRVYTEHGGPPKLELIIVPARAIAIETSTQELVAAADGPESSSEVGRPAARTTSLPRQAMAIGDVRPVSLLPAQPATAGPRRATAPAVLPSPNVVLPPGEGTPFEANAAPVAAAPSRSPLVRTDTLRDLPLPLAARQMPFPSTVSGPPAVRPLGLAMLPNASGESRTRQPAAAYAHRFVVERTPRDNRAAIDRGLDYLARVQFPDGRWRFDGVPDSTERFPQPTSLRADAAATGLALLAFLGAGHDHFDGRYQSVIRDGLDFLVRIEQHSGQFFDDEGPTTAKISRFYSHGIATLALAEAYGMTGDQRIRLPAQRALDHLAAALAAETIAPENPSTANDDASVLGWQLAALQSGQKAGLLVNTESLTVIKSNLIMRQTSRESASQQPQSDAVATAVGLAVELHLGAARNEERLRPAAEALLAHPPEVGAESAQPKIAADEPRRDTYYWYYGSQALHYFGGEPWQAWSAQLYPRLIQAQVAAGPQTGSWEPPTARAEHRADVATRLYVTAMNLLSLETEQRNPPRTASIPQAADRPK